MAIAFDAAVGFDSGSYTMDGGPAGVVLTDVDVRATITGPDSRAAIRSTFRASFDARANAAFRE